MSFKLTDLYENALIEDLIKVGDEAYPQGDNIVIFAGGSGSGKSFILKNLLGLEGKVFDPDELKTFYLKNKKLQDKLKVDYDIDISKFNMKDPKDVETLHLLLTKKGIHEKRIEVFLNTASKLTNKPNIVFDTTLSSLDKFNNIIKQTTNVGYKPENIHIVWVLTDYDTALENNARRDRQVPLVVFHNAHTGVSLTIKELLNNSESLNGLDGDIVLVFNNPKDTELKKSDKGGKYVSKSNYVFLKRKGQSPLSVDNINKEIVDKINEYIPKETNW